MIIFYANSRLLWIVAIFLIFQKIAVSQSTGDPHDDFLEGEYYVSQGMFADALPYYLSILKKDPDNSNVNYRVGLCYMKQAGEEFKALPYLQKAVTEIDPKYVEGKFKNTGAPPETWILLGDAYFRENRLPDASNAYNKYLDLIGNSDSKKLEVIKKRIDGVGISYELQRTSQNLQILNMGNNLNSKNSENYPILSGDQNTIVYTQINNSYEKIMLSHRVDGNWTTPIDITRQIGSEGDCYATGISADGTELYIIRHDELNSDIYFARFVKGKWQKMQPVPGKVNTRYHESGACVSADGNTLYFSSDRPKGIGGFDLYIAEKSGDIWGNLKNMGKVINTDKDEVAPFISSDGKVLYFSSNGHETVGNMDILYSEKDAEGNWQVPVNPGRPINTTNDELSYIYFNDTKTGYLSRNISQGFGKNDLYTVTPILEETVLTDTLPSPVAENIGSINTPKTDTATIGTVATPIEQLNNIVVPDEKNNITANSATVGTIQNEKTTERFTPEPATIIPLNSDPLYTIQILALIHPKNPGKIKLSSLIISQGNDGFTRYTHGEYINISEAQSSLMKLRKKGFSDAFIRKINTIPNYSKENK